MNAWQTKQLYAYFMNLGGTWLSVCFKQHAGVLNRGIFDEELEC